MVEQCIRIAQMAVRFRLGPLVSNFRIFSQPIRRRVAPQSRKAKGFRATGIDRAYISNLEVGKQNPTLETIAKIAEALGVSSGELLK